MRIIKFIPNRNLLVMALSGLIGIGSFILIGIFYGWGLAILILTFFAGGNLSKRA